MNCRLICYDCGTELKHKKAIERATVEKLENNIYRVFCRNCARKRNLPEEYEDKLNKVIKVFVRIAIVVLSIVFWNWYNNNNSGLGTTIMSIGAIIILLLFLLYDRLE